MSECADVNRKHFQNLAQTRLRDAKALLGRKRWSAAYYLSGYAVECGLKSCLLRYLGESSALFDDPKYLKQLGDCWTHDLNKLVALAGLETEFGSARGADVLLHSNWLVTKDWTEKSRYEDRTEEEAKTLYAAITQKPNGVFPWIRSRW